jgi:hypothetical protein
VKDEEDNDDDDDEDSSLLDDDDDDETEENKSDLEASWDVCVSGALHSLGDDRKIPLEGLGNKSRALQKNNFIIVLLKGFWELAKIVGSVPSRGADAYRVHLTMTGEYEFVELSADAYGKENESENRWVLLS